MKKIVTICLIATVAFACKKDDQKPVIYGDQAEVSTPNAAQDALDQGSTEITITEELTTDTSFSIPNGGDSQITINVPAGGNNVTVAQATGSGSVPDIMLNLENVNHLTLNTPDASVTIDGNIDGTMTASTAENTLTIAEGATVNNLVVMKGNVRNFGTITNVGEVAEGSVVLYAVSTADELRTRMTTTPYDRGTNGGVILTDDLSGVIPNPTGVQTDQDAFHVGSAPTSAQPAIPYDGYIIDGNDHTLSGEAYNNVLAIYANDVKVMNLTVLQTTEQKDAPNGPCNGISVYQATGIELTNVTLKDCGQYGLVINGSEVTATDMVSGGNGWGGVNLDNESPSLTLVSGDFSDTYAIVVESTATNPAVDAPDGWTSSNYEGTVVWSPAQ